MQACLRQISSRPDFPAFSHQIRQVMRILEDEDASLRYITDLILREYSLTLKVLRTANSIHYNRSGKPILSVTHAVSLLGLDAIRSLAGGMILFEHYRKQSAGLKELMLLSLLTANHARALATQAGYPREEAYLCGMVRNLGEILVACYYPQEYSSILLRMQDDNLTDREAALRVLHFTYDDLGQAVARSWNLPDKVVCCLSPSPPPPARHGPAKDLAELYALTAFSHGLSTAVYRREPEGARARINLLIKEYLPGLASQPDNLQLVLDAGLLETRETFSMLGIPLDGLHLRRQTQAALASLRDQPAFPESAPTPDLVSGGGLLEELVHEVESMLESPTGWDLNQAVLMIMEAIVRGGGFDRALFCLLDPRRGRVQGRIGLGHGSEALREKFRFPVSVRGGPIGAALTRKGDLFVSAKRVPTRAESQLLTGFGVAYFAVLPIVVDRLLVGCLYFDRLTQEPDPHPHTIELVSKLRHLAVRAIALKSPASRGG